MEEEHVQVILTLRFAWMSNKATRSLWDPRCQQMVEDQVVEKFAPTTRQRHHTLSFGQLIETINPYEYSSLAFTHSSHEHLSHCAQQTLEPCRENTQEVK